MKLRIDGMTVFGPLSPTISDSDLDYLLSGTATMKSLRGIMEDGYLDYVEFLSVKAACRFVKYLSEAGFVPWLRQEEDEAGDYFVVGF